MKLIKFGISGFRGFSSDKLSTIDVNDLTTLIGKNDAGKSSVLDAMDVFFNGISNLDNDDFHIDSDGARAESIELQATFSSNEFIVKLETVDTNLSKEGLLSKDGNLVITQKITKPTKSAVKTSITAFLPDEPDLADLYTLTNAKLKEKLEYIKEQYNITNWESVTKRTNSLMRQAIISYFMENSTHEKKNILVDTGKGGGKDIWNKLGTQLPLFQLFKTDRSNDDGDSEIQDPLKAVTKETLKGALSGQLDEITKKVRLEAEKQAKLTLTKLNEMDPELAKQLIPKFETPKWENVFKFSLDTDKIPLNKRGSGARRLILLNFFRAQADKTIQERNATDVIYAFEEPETAQHADHQRMLMQSFLEISNKDGRQVIITTHNPELAGMPDSNSIRQIKRNHNYTSEIENTPNLADVGRDLGVLPNVPGLPGRLKLVIFVEGPNDVRFIHLLLMKYCPEIFKNNDTVLIPFGGGSLKYWVNLELLKPLHPAEFYIFDNDAAGKSYENRVKRSGVSSQNIHLWDLGPIEFYFPYNFYNRAVRSSNQSKEKNKNDQSEELVELSPKEFHNANYDADIKPLKNILWSAFERKSTKLIPLIKQDEILNCELESLAKSILKAYDC